MVALSPTLPIVTTAFPVAVTDFGEDAEVLFAKAIATIKSASVRVMLAVSLTPPPFSSANAIH